MNTYLHIFKMGLQNTAAYRANFFFRALFNLVPLIAAIAMWRAIFGTSNRTIAGYQLAEMLSYYLIVTVVEITTAVTEDEWQIATDIKDGTIGQFLVRPIDYLRYRLCLFSANRVIYTAITVVRFWTVRAQGLVMAYYNLFSVTRVPDAAFSGAARAIFTLFIPLLLVANVPVRVLLGKMQSNSSVALLFAMSLVCFLASTRVWRLALRRYSSASS